MQTSRFRSARMAMWGMASLSFAAGTGCLSDFTERSFPLEPVQTVRLAASRIDQSTSRSTRQWLTDSHRQFAPLLPPSRRTPLLTEDIVTGKGRTINAAAHFRIETDRMQTLGKNFRGMKYSAQAGARGYAIEKQTASWPDFQQIWIPIHTTFPAELSLSGRVGYARDAEGHIVDADCIVVLPGMFGDHGVKRSEDMCEALRESGFHVLHLEPRGHGQTERRYPNLNFSYGVAEADDLLQVSDWLENQPHVRRTGLIGYCWNANVAIYAAWLDGKSRNQPVIAPSLGPLLPSYDPTRQRYSAGVIALSPVVRWEVLMDQLDYRRSFWKHPIFAAIQTTVSDRQERKGYEVNGNLRQVFHNECRQYDAYGIRFSGNPEDSYSFLRLVEYKDHPASNKLKVVRVPLLIIAGADDPLIPCQDVADLLATSSNPNVAGLILPTGGHVGFSAYCPRYYMSLITSFFSSQSRPAAIQRAEDPGSPMSVRPQHGVDPQL